MAQADIMVSDPLDAESIPMKQAPSKTLLIYVPKLMLHKILPLFTHICRSSFVCIDCTPFFFKVL